MNKINIFSSLPHHQQQEQQQLIGQQSDQIQAINNCANNYV